MVAAILCITVVWPAGGAAAAGAADEAAKILQETGVRGGLVVHLGCGDGRLTAALHAGDAYLVHGLDRDAARVDEARQTVRQLGLYGKVSIDRLRGPGLPYVDGLVNLLVDSTPGDVSQSEILRVLAPRGVAYAKQGDRWVKQVKPWPGDIDEWTHWLHGSDNNAVAMDRRVGPPRYLRWKSDPMWCRSHNGVPSSIAVFVSSAGRAFYVVDEGVIGQPTLPQQWTLVARDAFNGVLLWKRRLAGQIEKKCLVANGDRLYVTLGPREPLSILDAATGQTLGQCERSGGCREAVCVGGTVVFQIQDARLQRRGGGGEANRICAVDAANGRLRWEAGVQAVASGTLAAHEGRVCFQEGSEIVCLDLENGDPIWRAPSRGQGRGGSLLIYGGAVISAGGGTQAFDARSGRPLWTGPGVNKRLGIFGASGLVWVTRLEEPGRSFIWTPAPVVSDGYDPISGEVMRTVRASHLVTPGHHIRCYPAKATDRFLLLPKRGVEFLDLQGSDSMRNNWIRGPCGHGIAPANGLLYVPPHQCFCYPGVKLSGFNALSAEASQPEARPLSEEQRLVRGPAYGKVSAPDARDDSGDWPLYRHDARRSGVAGCAAPQKLERLWQCDLGGTISPPVAAGGALFTAAEDEHTVYCLDAASGTQRWSYTAGGRIDSPPALHNGLVLFGSRDGWLYCLRAADGQLVWRFQGAPTERLIGAFGQLESAWPLHGAVLIQDNVVYCTAGRSSFLDDGMYVYAIQPETGKILHRTRLRSERPNVTEDAGRPFDMEGSRSDILVSDGTDLYMFHTRLGPDLAVKPTPRITKLGDRKVGLHLMCNDGFLDKTWFDRTYWTYSRRWPGYYFAYNAPKSGQILVFDDSTTYGLHVFTGRRGHSPMYDPGTDGYELFADDNNAEPVLRPDSIGREKGEGYSRTRLPKWSEKIPVRVEAMVLVGSQLYLAGPPDAAPADDPLAAFEGRLGARLWVVSTSDGEKQAEVALDETPAFDGLIAANDRLYLATAGGRLICLGEE